MPDIKLVPRGLGQPIVVRGAGSVQQNRPRLLSQEPELKRTSMYFDECMLEQLAKESDETGIPVAEIVRRRLADSYAPQPKEAYPELDLESVPELNLDVVPYLDGIQ